MTVSHWHEDLAARDEAFACLQDLLEQDYPTLRSWV